MSTMLEKGKAVLKSQSFSQLMGAELIEFSEGYAELRLNLREDFQQNHGFIHGGVISYLADNCITFAGASVLGNSVTSEYKINYVRPAIGETLIAKSTVLAHGKRQAVCECKILITKDQKTHLVAVAQGTIVTIENRK